MLDACEENCFFFCWARQGVLESGRLRLHLLSKLVEGTSLYMCRFEQRLAAACLARAAASSPANVHQGELQGLHTEPLIASIDLFIHLFIYFY